MSFENRRSTMEGGASAGSTGANIQSQASVTQCKTGCGFYANSAFEGMCSKCFRDELLRRQEVEKLSGATTAADESPSSCPAAVEAIASTESSSLSDTAIKVELNTDDSAATASEENAMSKTPSLETGSPTIVTTKISSDKEKTSATSTILTEEEEISVKEKPKKHRCLTCKKKVGLTGFSCRCGGLFCAVHRYSDKHGCSFDYKELGQEQIRKNNPVVVGEKIKKL